MTVTNCVAAIAFGALLSVLGASGTIAAPSQNMSSPTKMADATSAQPVAVTEDDDSTTCSKPRKRLWVEGEGWIIRRVTICR